MGILDGLFGSYTGGINQTLAQQRGLYGQQMSFADALRQQMMGQGPNLAQQQLHNATQANMMQAAGLIGSQRGINPGLATRQIEQQRANIGQQAAGQSAEARLQQQLGAQQQLGGVYGQMQQGNLGQLQTLGGMQAAQNRLMAGFIGGGLNALGGVAGMQGLGGGRAGGAGGGGAGGQYLFGPGYAAGGVVHPEAHSALAGLFLGGGGVIPGHAQVDGDSEANDTVPIQASPGEIVLPRSVAKAANAGDKAKRFVEAIKKHRRMAEGGEVQEAPGMIDALKRWWAAPRGSDAEAGAAKAAAEEANKKINPTAQKAVEMKRARLKRLDEETAP